MKLNIDEKICQLHGLEAEQFLLAFAYRQIENPKKTLEELLEKEVFIFKEGKYYITQHWNDIIDEIICDSSGAIDDEERLTNLAQQMRECFPQGKMAGTPYYYRCNNKEVIQKLKKFFVTYGNYPDSKIIEATKRYVASFNGDYRYMSLIKYFISKMKPITEEDGTTHNVEYSPLADYLENKDNEVVSSGDWLMSSRN